MCMELITYDSRFLLGEKNQLLVDQYRSVLADQKRRHLAVFGRIKNAGFCRLRFPAFPRHLAVEIETESSYRTNSLTFILS